VINCLYCKTAGEIDLAKPLYHMEGNQKLRVWKTSFPRDTRDRLDVDVDSGFNTALRYGLGSCGFSSFRRRSRHILKSYYHVPCGYSQLEVPQASLVLP